MNSLQANQSECHNDRSRSRPLGMLKSVVVTTALSLLSINSARALDTDIYFNRSVGVQPNVVFYLDSSGSMRSRMDSPELYDNANFYAGPFDNNTYYYSLDGRIPTSPSNVQSGSPAFNHCATAHNHIEERNWGFYTGRYVARMLGPVMGNTTPPNVWLPLANGTWSPATPHVVDCNQDRFVWSGHGENTTQDPPPAGTPTTNAGYPWSSGANPIDWDPIGYATIMRGSYINYKLNPPAGPRQTRSEVMKRIVKEVGHRFPMMNAGVASMNRQEGSSINFEVGPLNDAGWRQVFENTLSEVEDRGGTPLAEGLLEVYRYFRGETVMFGRPPFGQSVPRAYDTSNWVYRTPITHECQRNHVVMLTDGFPWHDQIQQPIMDLPNFGGVTGNGGCFSSLGRTAATSCLDELAGYMATVDTNPSMPNVLDDDNDGVPDGQIVKVHPVGIMIDFELLQATADAAGTEYYTAQNAIQLENDLMDLLANLTRNQSVATSITTSSDQFNRLSHRNEVFIGQYEPTSRFQWQGNIKKYRIAYDGTRPYLSDSDEVNNPEVLGADGTIISTARSYWSSNVDGSNIMEGGVREQLANRDPATRRMYSRTTDTESNLTNGVHALDLSNAPVNAAMGAFERSSAERQNIMDYARGVDVRDDDADSNFSDGRGHIGAMARNQPIVIQYGGTEANPDIVVFAATSDGLLHGFDGMTGAEIFAVAPLESVNHFVSQSDNSISGKSRWWGMDGKLSAHVIDSNRDGHIRKADGDKALLYVSYGLGGRVLYTFDVTEANNRSAPQIIEVARKSNTSSARWAEYGHALAKPVPFRLRTNNSEKNFLAYSLGYDPGAEFSYNNHAMGRGISILRSSDGSQHWSGISRASTAQSDNTYNDMNFAFAAEPTPLDINNDGFADRLYAVDLGAQVWRFDLDDPFSRRSSASVDGGRVAVLGRDADGDRRRAFKPIQATLVQEEGEAFVALVLGTGDRMNPLASPNENRLYMIKDRDLIGNGTFDPVDNSDLYDATDNTVGETTNQTQLMQEYETIRSADGWYVDLPASRKAISTPLIAEGIVNYPVYSIPTNSHPCVQNVGEGTLYRMSLFDARPIFDYNNDSDLTRDDREVPLRAQGIPPDLVAHRDEDGNLSICAGLECLPADPNVQPGDETPKVYNNYWHQ